MKSLVKYHLISKQWGEGGYSYHFEYDLPQDEGDESDHIAFRKYLANITAKMGKYARDQLFHEISHDNDPTTIHFMYFPHHKVEATQVINGLPCILYEELPVNSKFSISRSGIEQDTMGIWDKDNHTFANPNELHN